jgi:transcriptional regulator with XRE-family HTH domain
MSQRDLADGLRSLSANNPWPQSVSGWELGGVPSIRDFFALCSVLRSRPVSLTILVDRGRGAA